MALLDLLLNLFRRHKVDPVRFRHVRYVESHAEVGKTLRQQQMVIVGKAPDSKWAIFECPCGHGHTIHANLHSTMRPRWRLSVKNGRPTLSPSIRLISPPY